jgi:dodecin
MPRLGRPWATSQNRPKPGSPTNVPKSNGSTLAPGMPEEKDEAAQYPSAVRFPPSASSTGRDRTKRHEKELSIATIKEIELVGLSPKSWHAAVEEALKEAAKSLHGISGIHVMSTTAAVRDKKITEYRATAKIALLVEKGKK